MQLHNRFWHTFRPKNFHAESFRLKVAALIQHCPPSMSDMHHGNSMSAFHVAKQATALGISGGKLSLKERYKS